MSIVKGKGTIVASDYIKEDLQSIVKKYEIVEKGTNLKMLRRPRDVLSRITDPALPSRFGGVVTANIGKSRLDRGSIKSTRLIVLHDSTVIWHQGLKTIHRTNSLEMLHTRAQEGQSDISLH